MTKLSVQQPDRATTWKALLAGYWIVLFTATHLPRDFPALPSDRFDKVVHAAAYAILAWLVAKAWEKSAGRLTGRHLRFAWFALVVYAAFDELTQLLVGRYASFGDWLADCVGAALGFVVFAAWRRKFA
jgi:VanZ family protein